MGSVVVELSTPRLAGLGRAIVDSPADDDDGV
jgi:hypothetical protein